MTTPDLITITISKDDLVLAVMSLNLLTIEDGDDEVFIHLGVNREDFKLARRRIIEAILEANNNEGHPQ